jgi:hypothetical protein
MIDQAVTQNTSGAMPIKESLRQSVRSFVSKPGQFVRNPVYLIVLGVYSLTYVAANMTNTWCQKTAREPSR